MGIELKTGMVVAKKYFDEISYGVVASDCIDGEKFILYSNECGQKFKDSEKYLINNEDIYKVYMTTCHSYYGYPHRVFHLFNEIVNGEIDMDKSKDFIQIYPTLRKKMTIEEIEESLGFKIEIVE